MTNVLYKIFSKVLANKLKKILPQIIIEYQNAFTKNRLISNNILVAFKTFHSMKNHKIGKTGYIALKLDMSKAYDKVEWSFLEKITRKLGFEERWKNLMIICVKIVSYSILVNCEPKELIHPPRGIHQGNPLSSFLFLLCTEDLLSLISKVENDGAIKGSSLSRRSPILTHLLFVDDSVLFCRSNRQLSKGVGNIGYL